MDRKRSEAGGSQRIPSREPQATTASTGGWSSVSGDIEAWFAELDRYADVPLFENGREQPATPVEEVLLE